MQRRDANGNQIVKLDRRCDAHRHMRDSRRSLKEHEQYVAGRAQRDYEARRCQQFMALRKEALRWISPSNPFVPAWALPLLQERINSMGDGGLETLKKALSDLQAEMPDEERVLFALTLSNDEGGTR